MAHFATRCLQVVAEVGVADALGGAPMGVAELAARTGVNEDALGRMLRLLAAQGVFAEGPDGYIHTAASEMLRSDHPRSLRAYARMIGMPAMWSRVTGLEQALRTGLPVADWANLLEYFSGHPTEASLFNAAMVAKAGGVVPEVVAAYDFASFKVIADIGGGRGHLLSAVLEAVPGASGILFDLPQVVEDAGASVSPRMTLQPGDFFADQLPLADAYLLMEVIHDWALPEATAILQAVRRAAPAHARLLIVEALVSEEPGPHFSKTLDVAMLAFTGGRERTSAEYQALLSATGFKLERVLPTRTPYSVVEATVATESPLGLFNTSKR